MDQGQRRLRGAALAVAVLACGAPVPGPPGDEADVRVFMTGGERGALEPCGCASGQLGGLSRRATALALQRPDAGAAITVSCGGITRGTDPLDALILETAMTALAGMAYDAHVPSATTLGLGVQAVERALAAGVPFLAANVTRTDGQATGFLGTLTKPIGNRVVTLAGLVLRDGAVLRDYVIQDPEQALSQLAGPAGGPDLLVIAGPLDAARQLARQAGPATLVLVGDPTASPTSRSLDGHVICSGSRGHFLLQARLSNPEAPPELVPLDESWPRDPLVDRLVDVHRQRIVVEGLLDDLYGRRSLPKGQSYLGPEACASCHASAHKVWGGSRHWQAMAELVPDGRHLDPDCLVCHTTGFGFRTGFSGRERTPALGGVTCEACHGPGGAHVAAAGQSPLRTQVQCLLCHDPENSPDFDRAAYWPRILHGF